MELQAEIQIHCQDLNQSDEIGLDQPNSIYEPISFRKQNRWIAELGFEYNSNSNSEIDRSES